MNTQNIAPNTERDILDVMREIEGGSSSHASPEKDVEKSDGAADIAGIHDPDMLRGSLEQKLKLIELVEGYSEAKGIVEKKQELKEAIEFLNELTEAMDA